MKIGLIGLGHLGKAIAGRLLQCDHSLVLWNRDSRKTEGLQAKTVGSPAAVAAECDTLFLCLFDSNAVQQVFTGHRGLLSINITGKTIIDLTTNHFAQVASFHDLCRKAEAAYLECPVLGSVVPAMKGALTVLVSGKKEIYKKNESLLKDIGSNIFFLKDPTLATKMKLINNLTLGSFMATIAEAVSFAEDIGLSKHEVMDILSVGGGSSLVLTAKKDKLLKEDFSTHFSSALIYKDLHCLMDLAYSNKKPLFTAATVKELYAKSYDEGWDKEDFSAIYKFFKKK